MKRIAVLAAFVILIVLAVLPAAAITWGELDTDHPHVGAMMYSTDELGLERHQTCTGTLIAKQVVLTAGHCVTDWEGYGVTGFYVHFCEDALKCDQPGDVMVDVADDGLIPHPDYYWGGSNPHDVGLLLLEEPVTELTPATLPDEGMLTALKKDRQLVPGPDGTKFTLVGYGGSLNWPPPDIYYDDLRQYAFSEYRALNKVWLIMSQNIATGDGGTCYGDSGGPAFWKDPISGEEYLVGVTSWGDAQCMSLAMQYRTDTADTLDFVAEYMP